jgi:hypothetical protein
VNYLLQKFIGAKEVRSLLSESNNYSVLVSNGLIPAANEVTAFPVWTDIPTITFTEASVPTNTVTANEPTFTAIAVPTLGIGSTLVSQKDGMILIMFRQGISDGNDRSGD